MSKAKVQQLSPRAFSVWQYLEERGCFGFVVYDYRRKPLARDPSALKAWALALKKLREDMPAPPSLTPLQVLTRIRASGDFEEGGFRFYLDAPQGCDDASVFFPVATTGREEFFPAGDIGEGVTETTSWIYVG